jgi:polyhydroxybutyrate depolymerase
MTLIAMKTKNFIKISILSVLVTLCGSLFSQIQTFEWQGIQRQYLIRVPQQTNKETMPVLYFLHGWTDNITHVDNEFHFQQIADAFEWTIVIPQARDEGSGTMWNAGLNASNTDDSGFLMALLDSLVEPYHLNLDSVFFTGFSMGGFMTHRMAIEHGDRITACAPVSGLITHSMANYAAVAPVRMLYIHGTADPVVGYSGTSQYFGNLGLGADAIIDYWKNANQCASEPVIDTFPDLKNDGLLFVRYKYEGDAELQHIKVIGGNHTWYHSEDQYDIGYLTEIHKFFTQKEGGNDGLGETGQNSLRLWPNPTSGQFYIEVESNTKIEVMDVHGRSIVKYALCPGKHLVDLDGFPEGLYLVKDEKGFVKKLLLTK